MIYYKISFIGVKEQTKRIHSYMGRHLHSFYERGSLYRPKDSSYVIFRDIKNKQIIAEREYDSETKVRYTSYYWNF